MWPAEKRLQFDPQGNTVCVLASDYFAMASEAHPKLLLGTEVAMIMPWCRLFLPV